MSVTYLIQCHKGPEQVRQMISMLDCADACFVVHVDAKSKLCDFLFEAPNVRFIKDEDRVNVKWARISVVDSALVAMREALAVFGTDYYWLCSGQDLPLASPSYICNLLQVKNPINYIHIINNEQKTRGSQADTNKNESSRFKKRNQIHFPQWVIGKETHKRICRRILVEATGGYTRTFSVFLKNGFGRYRFYFGSNWMCLRREVVLWMLHYIDNHPEYRTFFKDSFCPDESFFQTLFMMSPYSAERQNYLHYVDWSQGGGSPKLLVSEDLDTAFASGKLMARKFDLTIDREVAESVKARIRVRDD